MYFMRRSIPLDPGKWAPKSSIKYINLALIEKSEVNKVEADEFTKASIHGDIDDIIRQKRHMEIEDVAAPNSENGSLPKYILVEGAPGVGKTTFAWELSKRWGKGEILQHFEMVVLLRLREIRVQQIKTISDLFFYSNNEIQLAVSRQVEQTQGEKVLFIFEGFDELSTSKRKEDSFLLCRILSKQILPASTVLVTTRHSASDFLFERFGEPDQHIQILGFTHDNITSYYVSVLGDKDHRSRLVTAFKKYLDLHPHILSAMYVPLHCAIVVEVFLNGYDSQMVGKSKATIPKTMTQLYHSLTKNLLLRYLKKHPKYRKRQYKIQQFDKLPDVVITKLKQICEFAYKGLTDDRVIFTDNDIPHDMETLELMQSIPELYVDEGTVVSYNFIHLTLQEFLAAYHIACQKPWNWIQKFHEHKNDKKMKVVLRFLAGLTAFSGLRKKNIRKLVLLQTVKKHHQEITVDGLHWLFEAQFDDPNFISSVLGRGTVRIDCTWSTVSQFDCFVLGFCIARSRCKWELEMCECDIGEDGLEILTNAVKSNVIIKPYDNVSDHPHHTSGFISDLRLRGNGITSKALCTFFEQTPQSAFMYLQEIELGNNEVDATTCDVLARHMPFMPQLHSISLSGNPIGRGGVTNLLNSWSNAHHRKLLSLFNTKIGSEETKLVAELIAKHPGIEVVYLGGCEVPNEVAELILQSLKKESSYLKQLYFSGAVFTQKTSHLLADVFRVNKTIEVIDARSCNIDEEGGRVILDALKENTTLQDLMIVKGNSFGKPEAEYIHERFPQEGMMGPDYA